MSIHFSKTLTQWYFKNKRNLPWRNTQNPYYVWLSEVILQQTRVVQGLNYYLRFIDAYPTIFDLAKADEQEILKLWQGLGYYSRARNLHFSAKYIVNECNGKFPNTYNEILKLKGVGDYTASAISSICFNEPNAVVDGNVYRVLARYFGIKIPINSSKGIRYFKELAQTLLDRNNPGVYNQAIMDFGAMQCKPQNPNCNECVLNNSCDALLKNNITNLPIKEKKLKIKKLFFNYLVILNSKNEVIIEKRTKGFWKNLYQFPLIETTSEITYEELKKHPNLPLCTKKSSFEMNRFYEKLKIHKLSHRHIYTQFWIVFSNNAKGETVLFDKIEAYPVPTLIHNFIEDFKKN